MRCLTVASRVRLGGLALMGAVAAIALGGLVPCVGHKVDRNTFESNRTWWTKASADVGFDEIAHTISEEAAHEGRRSEYIQIKARPGPGSNILYYYPTAPAPIDDDLSASLWVKSNQPGIQLMA